MSTDYKEKSPVSTDKEPGYIEVEGADTSLGRLSLGRAGIRWLVYLGDEEMCCGASEPYARCWYGAADFWNDRIQVRLAQLEQDLVEAQSMACIEADPECGCAGCECAREAGGS